MRQKTPPKSGVFFICRERISKFSDFSWQTMTETYAVNFEIHSNMRYYGDKQKILMELIAWIFYGILAFTCIVSAGFIIFHIFRYSLRRSNGIVGASLFILVFSLLFLSNILLFSSIPFETITNNPLLPSSNGF